MHEQLGGSKADAKRFSQFDWRMVGLGPAPRSTGSLLLLTAAVVSVSAAALDLWYAIPDSPESWSRFGEVITSFATTACLVLFGFVLLGAIGLHLASRLRLQPVPLLAAAAVLVLTAMALFSSQQMFAVDVLRGTRQAPVKVCLGFSALAALTAYLVLWERSGARLWPLTTRLCVALPFALSEALLYRWYRLCLPDMFERHGTLFRTGLAAAIAATVWICCRISLRSAAVALVLLVLAASVGGGVHIARLPDLNGSAAATSTAAHKIRHVLLITVDTLRADALSCYNSGTAPTPGLDQLAAQSVVFRKAYSASSWTCPAVASLMTGLPVSVHQVDSLKSTLPASFPTLAQVMRSAGYATAAIVENPILRPAANYMLGFDEYLHLPRFSWPADALGRGLLRVAGYAPGGASMITDVASRWIARKRNRDFFLWVHYFDPHVPYRPPLRFLFNGRHSDAVALTIHSQAEVRSGMKVTSEERSWMHKLYVGEARYADEQIGKLLTKFKQDGFFDDSLIVFTSDHGEEFWEHGGYEHGHSLHDEVVSVPLMVKLPGATTQTMVTTSVSTQFTMPTILDLAGIPYPSRCYNPPSLAPLWRNPQAANTGPIFSSGTLYYEDASSVQFDHYRLISRPVSRREYLYDLSRDPHENASLTATEPAMVERGRNLERQAESQSQAIRRCYAAPSRGPRRGLSPDDLRRLRSLGYIQ